MGKASKFYTTHRNAETGEYENYTVRDSAYPDLPLDALRVNINGREFILRVTENFNGQEVLEVSGGLGRGAVVVFPRASNVVEVGNVDV